MEAYHGFFVLAEGFGSAQLGPACLGGFQARVYALTDDAALEFRHGHENIELQLRGGVHAGRVYALRGTDQGYPAGGEFPDDLGQMGQATAQAVQLEAEDDIHPAPANVRHKGIQALAAEFGAADGVGMFHDPTPAPALAVFAEFTQLAIVGLLISADAGVDGDF